MSVTYKMISNNGTTGEERRKGCWGIFKYNWLKNIEDTLSRMNRESCDSDNDDRTRYGNEPISYEQHLNNYQRELTSNTGLDEDAVRAGINSVIITGLNIREGEVNSDALDTVLKAYPKLFIGITNIDKERGEITLTLDQHYGILYNQLRTLKKFRAGYLKSVVAEEIAANPDLSIFLLDIYFWGRSSGGDSTLFKVETLTLSPKHIQRMLTERDWILSDEDRANPAYNAMLRNGCMKHKPTVFADLSQEIPDGDYSSEEYNVPNDMIEFIDLCEERGYV